MEHNASSPREHHIVDLVDRALSKVPFPHGRIELSVKFDLLLGEPSTHTLLLDDSMDLPVGEITINYNPLFSYQAAEDFFYETVPHEIAHVLNVVEKLDDGQEQGKPHDNSWKGWFHRIAPDVDPKSSGSKSYDYRAIKLYKGGMPARCTCGTDAGHKVFSSRGKIFEQLKSEELTCALCNDPYSIIDDKEMPEKVVKEREFIREQLCKVVTT